MLRRVLTFLGYIVLTLIVIGLTAGLVAYGNGYTYSLKTHKVTQTGLVLITSTPNGTPILFNGRNTKKRSPYRASFNPGDYKFSIVKDGFWPWEKTLTIVGGQVTLAQYAIMVPKKPVTSSLDAKTLIVGQSISKDHRHLAYVVAAGPGAGVYTLDLGNPKPVKLYTPKVATPTTADEVLGGAEWSDDASHLLITSTVGGVPVQRLAAASGGDPVNLTDQYHQNFAGIKFSANNWRQLYWIAPDGLRRLDVDAQNVSGVLAETVTQFWAEPYRVLYVQQTNLGKSLWSLDNRGHHQELIQALVESDSYSLDFINYRGQDELAIVPLKTGTGTLYTDIYGNNPVAKTIAHGVTGANFSPDGHFLAFTAPTFITTYDLEKSLIDNSFVLYNIVDQPGSLASVTWFDAFHMLLVRDGSLYLSEYDGANRVALGSAVPGFPAYGTADLKSLIEFKPTGNGMSVTQVQIKQ